MGIVTEHHTHTQTNTHSRHVNGGTHVHLMSSNSTSPQQRHQALPQGSPSLRSAYTFIVVLNRGQGSCLLFCQSVCASSRALCSADGAEFLNLCIGFISTYGSVSLSTHAGWFIMLLSTCYMSYWFWEP